VQVVSPGEYVCSHCGTEFDDNPNEGGDYSADPSKRMERAEARRGKRC
jgi:DNA-directed RNA polymerase subunit RPC12/RpoP